MTGSTRARLATISVLACAALLAASPHALGKTKDEQAEAAKPAPGKSKADDKNTKAGSDKAAKPVSGKPAAQGTAAKPAAKDQKSPKDQKSAKAPAGKPAAKKLAKPVPLPPIRPAGSAKLTAPGATYAAAVPMPLATAATESSDEPAPTRSVGPLSYAPAAALSGADIDSVKEAIALARSGKTSAASERKAQIRDAAAQKLIEWAILRADDNEASFARYVAFINANPSWPSVGMLRRRAEGQLWHEKRDAGTVFAFFSQRSPASAKGKLAAARALLTDGDRAQAQEFVREAWRQDPLSAELETQVLESFGELLTRADHKARMDRRLYAEDSDAALRAARRLGGDQVAIAQARIAVSDKDGKAGALLEAVPASARSDAGYTFSRIQWLRRQDRVEEAAQLMLSAPRDPESIIDTNEWWVERRLIARKLLDAGNVQAAYRIARDAARPEKGNYRAEQPFTAGWIALRFLNDPATAMGHFATIAQGGTRSPIALARAGYWQGR
ncbi:MAG TPA: lytic transglycosylase domain-containing protein, partial [Xanthobacteraceae bacterium]